MEKKYLEIKTWVEYSIFLTLRLNNNLNKYFYRKDPFLQILNSNKTNLNCQTERLLTHVKEYLNSHHPVQTIDDGQA